MMPVFAVRDGEPHPEHMPLSIVAGTARTPAYVWAAAGLRRAALA